MEVYDLEEKPKKGLIKKVNYKAIFGIVSFLAIAVVLTVVAFSKVSDLRSHASPTAEPTNVIVSNVTDTSFTVSWLTVGVDTAGAVKYGTVLSDLNQTASDYTTDLGTLHYVEVAGLTPDSIVYFTINVGDKEYLKDGRSYEVQLHPTPNTPPTPFPVKGLVKGDTDVVGTSIVELTVKKDGQESSSLTTLTNDNGTYVFDLGGVWFGNTAMSFSGVDNLELYVKATDANGVEGSISALGKL